MSFIEQKYLTKMTDSKSPKSKSKTASGTRTPGSTGSKPSAAARPSSKRSGDPNAPMLIKKEAPSPEIRRVFDPAAQPEWHPWLDPERLGRVLHHRPAWFDELAAIVLFIFGLVSLLSLLNTSSSAALSTLWSDTIRQFFGQAGAVALSIMIMIVGLLIVLPRLGIHVSIPSTRVIAIEAGYVGILAALHLAAHDPEPRALARSGQAGGFVGYIVSWPLFKLFGTSFALFIFVVLVAVAFGFALGVRRTSVRRFLFFVSKQFELIAERMKREPQPRQTGMTRSAAGGAGLPDLATVQADLAGTSGRSGYSGDSMLRPARQSEPVAQALYQPAVPPGADALRTAQPTTPGIDLTPMPKTLPRAAPKPVKPVQEKRTRYFTVEDFKETRKPIQRVQDDLPRLGLLNDMELNKPTEQEINNNVRVIENTLMEFDIDVEVVDVKVGPTVTQYAVQPFREVTNAEGEVVMQRVRVNKIASLVNDLALALSAKRLRIQPYVPGHPYMGIEVPNRTPSTVALRPVMESETFANAFVKQDPDMPNQRREVPLTVPLGRDVSGAAFVVDLAAMPHLLIAGTTGSGKSVCITALATALVMNNSPERLNLVMLDPKMVELSRFNGLPHLLGPVETDLERIIGVLRWATREMDRRYKLLEAEASRNIESYNKTLGSRRQDEQLPYIVIIIDEIGDLMLSRPDEMERTLTRLAQMARAVGMHLVVATQRPSVDVITGLIKANFPARISFAVASGVDSRVILDQPGAERLLGRGDMLFQSPDAASPLRMQGVYVSDSEIQRIVRYWKGARGVEAVEVPAAANAPEGAP